MKNSKRLIALLLVLMMALACLTGCGLPGIGDDDDDATDSLEYSVEQTRGKLNAIAAQNGLEIKVRFHSEDSESEDEDGLTLFGMMANTYWQLDEDGDGIAIVLDKAAGKAYYYTTDYDGAWEYSYSMNVSEEDVTGIESYFGLTSWLYFGHIYDGMFKKSGTVKIAGRTCDLYTYKLNMIVEKVEYTFAVDHETGATMKYEIGARVGTESAAAGFEVTSFKTSGVVIPDLPAPDNDGPEGDDPLTNNTGSIFARELAVVSPDELVSERNVKIVAKYTGTQTQLTEEDDTFIDDYGTLDIYLVWYGFDAEGNADFLRGFLCLYYFFDGRSAYDAARAEVSSYNLRGANPECNYFTVRTTSIDGETYDEMIEALREGDFRHPHFTVVE